MSYSTIIEFTFPEEPPEFGPVLDRAREYLETRRETYPDVDFVLEQLRRALEEEKGDFKGLDSEDILGLMGHVSAGVPGPIFHVRGWGEEFPDLWLRSFKDGTVIFRAGPFGEELDAALGDMDD